MIFSTTTCSHSFLDHSFDHYTCSSQSLPTRIVALFIRTLCMMIPQRIYSNVSDWIMRITVQRGDPLHHYLAKREYNRNLNDAKSNMSEWTLLSDPQKVKDFIAYNEDIQPLLNKVPASIRQITQPLISQQTVHSQNRSSEIITKFDIVNYTFHVVGFNNQRQMLINGQPVKKVFKDPFSFTADDCQLVVYHLNSKTLAIHEKDLGLSHIGSHQITHDQKYGFQSRPAPP
jgi:hypothetical protein